MAKWAAYTTSRTGAPATANSQCFEAQLKKAEFKPEKPAIGGELTNGSEIPGADLKFGEFRLVIG